MQLIKMKWRTLGISIILGFMVTSLAAQNNNLILQGSSSNQWNSTFIKFDAYEHDDEWFIAQRGSLDIYGGFKGLAFFNHNVSENSYDTPLFLDEKNKVGIGTTEPDFKLTVNGFTKIGGTGSSQLMLADRGWGGSHAILFNSYPSETFVNGGLNVFQNTRYANDSGQFNNGAGGVFFNANGGVFEIKLSKASTGKDQVVEWQERSHLSILRNGNVAIGVLNGENYILEDLAIVDHKLTVNGKIRCQEVKVTNENWPDYVFEEDYDLLSLEELNDFIKLNNHLPNIPSAKKVEQDGFYLGELDSKLLEKIEELTLYTIQQEEALNKLKEENIEIKRMLAELLKSK